MRAPVALETEWRSVGSKRSRPPWPSSIVSFPAATCTVPSTTGDPRVLLHLVIAEGLAGLEHDEHRARSVVLVDDERVARAVRRLDREKIPVLHD